MPKFTDRFLAALKVDEGRKDRLGFDIVGPGLGIRVTAKGTRTFLAQWTDPVTRRKVRQPLGGLGNITIDQARGAARIRVRGGTRGREAEGAARAAGSRSR